MKLRALGRSARLLVAAPDYLAARGRPAVPRDLSGHEGIRMSNIAGSDMLALQGPRGKRHVVPFAGRLRVDHGLAAREALVAGAASPPPIDGLSMIFWRPAGWPRSCRTIRCLRPAEHADCPRARRRRAGRLLVDFRRALFAASRESKSRDRSISDKPQPSVSTKPSYAEGQSCARDHRLLGSHPMSAAGQGRATRPRPLAIG